MDYQLSSSSNSSGSETGFIRTSMKHKSLFITGSTGFLAKVFMEKVLRVQPQVKKLYLLLRAEDTKSAKQRFQEQVIGKEVFSVLREQHGEGFNSFISSKVVPLPGDISLRNLGIKDFNLEQEMFREIDFIINVAATTNFDERYDVALSINTLGAKHVCEFAKKCRKLELLLHVSTAYVTREKGGLILEKLPLRMGELTNQNSTRTLNLEMELKIAEQRLQQLQEEEATEETTKTSMIDLGLQRARLQGWSNTYVFTKAMGEMLVAELGENHVAPVVIVRPSIITSTYKQPFPGWIEGSNTFDVVVQYYAKGGWTHFVADPRSTLDVIPADMVVNAMMVAMSAHPRDHNTQEVIIYHVCSYTQNPINYTQLMSWAFDYFSMNPLLNVDEKPIRVPRWTLLPSMDSFSKYEILQYKLPLEALRAVNILSFNKSFADVYSKLNRQYNSLIRLLELCEPVVLFKGIFDNSNLKKLQASMIEEDQKDFDFDSKHIDLEDYFKNVHFPGSTKHAFGGSRISARSRL